MIIISYSSIYRVRATAISSKVSIPKVHLLLIHLKLLFDKVFLPPDQFILVLIRTTVPVLSRQWLSRTTRITHLLINHYLLVYWLNCSWVLLTNWSILKITLVEGFVVQSRVWKLVSIADAIKRVNTCSTIRCIRDLHLILLLKLMWVIQHLLSRLIVHSKWVVECEVGLTMGWVAMATSWTWVESSLSELLF